MCFLQRIGEEWVTDLFQLRKLLPLASEQAFMTAVYKCKQVHTHSDWQQCLLIEQTLFALSRICLLISNFLLVLTYTAQTADLCQTLFH